MSVTRTHRLIRLLNLLQSGRSFDADTLSEALDISRRTLFRDLKLLEAAHVPYVFDRKTQQYRIKQEYFLPPVNLTMTEALALMLTTRKLTGERIHPDETRAIDAALKVEAAIPPVIRRHCGDLLEAVEVRHAPASDVDSIRHLMHELDRALLEKRKLRLKYDSYRDGESIDVLLHPYRKVFISRGWYILGLSEYHDEVRTFKIERIEHAELLSAKFEPDPEFDLDDHFGNAWRMIPEGTEHHVKIRFAPYVAGNVEEVLWHKTQQTQREPDDSLIFEVDVDGLNEISWWILGYGDQAEVLEPPELRTKILNHARHLVERYDSTE